MDTPLFSKLQSYAKNPRYPFHMPGHKMGRGMDHDLFAMDLTEIDGFDNLHQAQGVILEAEERYAASVGAKRTFFLVNGASCGLQAAMLAICGDADEVIVARNCHKSVWDGLIFSGAMPRFFYPEPVEALGVFGACAVERVAKAIQDYPKAKAVFLTSPTYEGMLSDIASIAALVHQAGMVLVVDEAHGAHLPFLPSFPDSAIGLGADVVIQSCHKMMPAPTQTAVLHLCSNRVDEERLKQALSMVQSSSPSYLLMGYLDRSRAMMEEREEGRYEAWLEALRQGLGQNQRFLLFDGGKNYDRSKLILFAKKETMLPVGEALRHQFGLEAEFVLPTHICLMTSPFDTAEGGEKLQKAISFLEKTLPVSTINAPSWAYPLPKTALSPRQCRNQRVEKVALKEALGEVAAQAVIPYPPGIPLLFPGEIITKEVLLVLEKALSCHGNVMGICADGLAKISIIRYDKVWR